MYIATEQTVTQGIWLEVQRTRCLPNLVVMDMNLFVLVMALLGHAVGLVPSALVRSVRPSPATHAILAQLKAGETVHQAGELPKTLRVSKIHY